MQVPSLKILSLFHVRAKTGITELDKLKEKFDLSFCSFGSNVEPGDFLKVGREMVRFLALCSCLGLSSTKVVTKCEIGRGWLDKRGKKFGKWVFWYYERGLDIERGRNKSIEPIRLKDCSFKTRQTAYFDDIEHGKEKFYYQMFENDVSELRTWVYGEETGESINYYVHNRVAIRVNLRKGLMHGERICYDWLGKILSRQKYENGVLLE
ncbi:hypothetical protein GMAR_ORF90 [Golden Marseillevirus]|uniref:hypothetical protein n=1 Tax=Golden Marseillevirus TaxID=1720526 RepID=UPI000877A9A4|nr:hypothetical protein GMAR_ORF90 [Golden Marseillevirus]ALX27465.1 hypothetical protein GMAR_ORF90 [Golden Marseillevirus]